MRDRLRRRRGNRMLALVMAIGVFTVLGGALVSALLAGADRTSPVTGYAAPPTAYPGPTSTIWTAPTTDLPPPATSTADTPFIGVPDPEAELAALAAADLPALRTGIEGRWVAQLSSKRPGMTVGATTYDHTAILSDHLALRSSYANIRLAWSGDWATFSAQDFWVTIVATPYATPEEANAWCDDHGLPADGCYAKRVSATGGTDRNTVPR